MGVYSVVLPFNAKCLL